MKLSSAIWVSLAIQLVLILVLEYAPRPQPDSYSHLLQVLLVAVIPPVATTLKVPLYPAGWNLSWVKTGIGLTILGVLPPIVGLIEARLGHDPQIFQSDRFVGHLRNNVVGALAATLLVWISKKVSGDRAFTDTFTDKAALNCLLPMTVLSSFAFVRWQQATSPVLTGYSLKHLHQMSNLVFLIAVYFTAATSVLYLFAFAIRARSQHAQPVEFSWQVGVAMVAALAFFYACGLGPWTPQTRANNLTFLTGTPAALAAVVVWLSLLKPGVARNWFMITITTVGYLLYCAEAILGSRSSGEDLQPYYFAPGLLAIGLSALAIALYRSPEDLAPPDAAAP